MAAAARAATMDSEPFREEVMSSIGLPEIAIVLVIVLVIFGPKRLPQLGRSLGSGMREFKDAVTGKNKDDDDHDAIEAAPATPAAPAEHVTTATPDDAGAARAKAADAS
jgi:sec-independent protein translocase protein TatA